MQEELIAVRIKDGIFVGNVVAAEDKDFLMMNKITHIINCAGGEVGNFFIGEPGFRYLCFPWKDVAGSVCSTILFDPADDNINRTVQFVDETLSGGECVLIHSMHGVSRSAALVVAYLMTKYNWKLDSALGYLKMSHPDATIKPHFLRQLRQFAKSHSVEADVFDRNVDDTTFCLDNDQWMLRNTLLNGLTYEDQKDSELYKQCVEKVDTGSRPTEKKAKPRISFIDTQEGSDVVAAHSTPVVTKSYQMHADPTSMDDGPFIGSRGTTSLRSNRRSPSILSRSVSPCPYRLESDPRTCPKGRQVLSLVPNAVSEATSSPSSSKPVDRSQTLANAASRTNSATANVEKRRPSVGEGEISTSNPRLPSTESNRSIDYARLAPPAPIRSPFATLSSSNKYRNGSPLPVKEGKKPTGKITRTKVASSPSSRSPSSNSVGHAGSLRNPSSASTSNPITSTRTKVRTGSPLTSNRLTHDAIGRVNSSTYKGIAPSRSATSTAMTNDLVRHPTISRTYSPLQSAGSTNGGLRSSSRRRTLSPTTEVAKRSSSSSSRTKTTPNSGLPASRTQSPKSPRENGTVVRRTNSSPNSSFDSNSREVRRAASSATSKGTTLHRQLPPAISSRRLT